MFRWTGLCPRINSIYQNNVLAKPNILVSPSDSLYVFSSWFICDGFDELLTFLEKPRVNFEALPTSAHTSINFQFGAQQLQPAASSHRTSCRIRGLRSSLMSQKRRTQRSKTQMIVRTPM